MASKTCSCLEKLCFSFLAIFAIGALSLTVASIGLAIYEATTGTKVWACFSSCGNELNQLQSDSRKMKMFHKVKARTCQDYFDNGLTDSGEYMLDPDELGPNEPFWAFCDAKNGVTQISWDFIFLIPDIRYSYTVKMENMVDLITISRSCKQSIEITCKNAQITSKFAWKSRNGEKQTYFSGANFGRDICECADHPHNNCFKKSSGTGNVCNCDQNDDVERVDSGYITNKTALPITGFTYSYSERLQNSQKFTVIIGPLICSGQINLEEELLPYCQYLKWKGFPSGNYMKVSKHDARISSMHKCNMSLSLDHPEFSKEMDLLFPLLHILVNDFRPQNVSHLYFFDEVANDALGSFDVHTSNFNVPWTGNYTFKPKMRFNEASKVGGVKIGAMVNNKEFFSLESDITKSLQRNDNVTIVNNGLSYLITICNKTLPCTLEIVSEATHIRPSFLKIN